MKKLFLVALSVSLITNNAQALSCTVQSYWQDDTTNTIYYGFEYMRDSPEELARYNIIVKADKNSFDGLKKHYSVHAKDKDHVYLFGKIIPNMNPKTYSTVEGLEHFPNNAALFTKDDKHLYFKYDALIHDGDLATIQVFDQHFSRDKNALYFNGYLVPNMNPDTFKAISWKPDPPHPHWGWGCDFLPNTYIDKATDGKSRATHKYFMKKYGPWRIANPSTNE